ncbi:hypothetical protein ACFQY5_22350 [Paeniroseomonas aquatica]
MGAAVNHWSNQDRMRPGTRQGRGGGYSGRMSARRISSAQRSRSRCM